MTPEDTTEDRAEMIRKRSVTSWDPPKLYPGGAEYSARSVPVDSAALYEAVNAWVEVIVSYGVPNYGWEHLEIDTAHRKVIRAAYNLAEDRNTQRRAQQTETGQ